MLWKKQANGRGLTNRLHLDRVFQADSPETLLGLSKSSVAPRQCQTKTRDRSQEMIADAQTAEAIPSRTSCSQDRLGPSPLQLPTHGGPCRPVAWHYQAEWSCRPGGSRSLRQTHAVRPKVRTWQAQSGLSEWSRHLDPYGSKTGRLGAQARLERACPFDGTVRDLRFVFWMRRGRALKVTRGAGTSLRSMV